MDQYDGQLNQRLQQIGVKPGEYSDYLFVVNMISSNNGLNCGGGPPEYGGISDILFFDEQMENFKKVTEKNKRQ